MNTNKTLLNTSPRIHRLYYFLLYMVLFYTLLAAFSNIMTFFDHNESMYITAGVLLSQGKHLYTDFAFLQTPLLPLLYAGIFKIFGINSYYLLTAKFISLLLFYMSAYLLYILARLNRLERPTALVVAALFLMNTAVLTPSAESSNYALPLTLSIAGFLAFESSLRTNKYKVYFVFLSGVAIALSVSAKLTYAAVSVPYFIYIIFTPLIKRRQKPAVFKYFVSTALPFVAGFSLGLLPIAAYLHKAPLIFIFDNYKYHLLTAQWQSFNGSLAPSSLYEKISFARKIYSHIDVFIVIIGILISASFSIKDLRHLSRALITHPPCMTLAILLLLFSIPAAIAPTPSYYQYYAMPVSCLFIVLIYSFSINTNPTGGINIPRRLSVILVTLCILYNSPVMLKSIIHMKDRNRWTGLKIHDISSEMDSILSSRGYDGSRKIATLAPIFPVEINRPIFDTLATGPFLYRIGDMCDAKQRARQVGTSPQTVEMLLDSDPPDAIITLFEGKLDDTLSQYAVARHYENVDINGFNINGYQGEFYINTHNR